MKRVLFFMIAVLLSCSYAHAQLSESGRTPERERLYQELLKRAEERKDTHVPASYYSCLLERHPGTMNDAVAHRITRQCRDEHPRVKGEAPNIKRFQLFGQTTAEECFVKHAKGTGSQASTIRIREACNALY